MEDTYLLNGEPVARYEAEQLQDAEAVLGKFINLGTETFRLKLTIDTLVEEAIAQTPFPQVALQKVNKQFSNLARSADAKILQPWRVTLSHEQPEIAPGCGVGLDGHTLPQVYFLPVNPNGGIYRRFGDGFAAIAQHSLTTYEMEDGIPRQSMFDGWHGIIATYPDIVTAQDEAVALKQAVAKLGQPAASPLRTDPSRYVATYTEPDPL